MSTSVAASAQAASRGNAAQSAGPNKDHCLAYALLRVAFGFNIMFHGIARLLVGHAGFLAYLTHYFEKVPAMPPVFLNLFGWVLPPVETALGLLLVLGLFSRFAMIAGFCVMVLLVFGTNLAQDWIVSGLQLIYCIIYYFLLVRRDLNTIAVDGLFQRRS